MTEDDRSVIANMRARAEQCRRLAKAILDRRATEVLLNMAEEIEGDIRRLESGQDADPVQEIPPPVQE